MPEGGESALVRERREKNARLRAEGIEPYPWSFPGRQPTKAVVDAGARLAPGSRDPTARLRVAGRLRAIRVPGTSAFSDLAAAARSLAAVPPARGPGAAVLHTC